MDKLERGFRQILSQIEEIVTYDELTTAGYVPRRQMMRKQMEGFDIVYKEVGNKDIRGLYMFAALMRKE